MKLTTAGRVWLLLAAGVGALWLLLYAKQEALVFFLAHRAAASVASLVAPGLVLWGAARAVRASGLALASVALPCTLFLLVDLVVSPLPYEIAHEASLLPHPAGALAPGDVVTSPFYAMGHPVAIASFEYAADRNATTLAQETLRTLEAHGWQMDTPVLPGGRAGPYAILGGTKSALRVDCTVGAPQRVLLVCTLSV